MTRHGKVFWGWVIGMALCLVPVSSFAALQFSETSTKAFSSAGGQKTEHVFIVPSGAVIDGNGSLLVGVRGDFNATSEYAEVSIEGVSYGKVNGGKQCSKDYAYAVGTVSKGYLENYVKDGQVVVTVQNSSSVNFSCSYMDHEVTLSFPYTTGPVITAPEAPQNLKAIAGSGQVGLTWSKPGSDGGAVITEYWISRGKTAASLSLLSKVSGNTLTYTDSTVSPGNDYVYGVSAVNSTGAGPEATASVTIPFAFTATPDTVAVSAGKSATITLSGGSGIYQKVSSSDTTVAQATLSGNKVTVTGVSEGTATLTVTDSAFDTVTVDVTVTSLVVVSLISPQDNSSISFATGVLDFTFAAVSSAKGYILNLNLYDMIAHYDVPLEIPVATGTPGFNVSGLGIATYSVSLDEATWDALALYAMSWNISALSDAQDLSSVMGTSSTWNFKLQPSGSVTLVTPVEGTTLSTATDSAPTFKWDLYSGASSYDLILAHVGAVGFDKVLDFPGQTLNIFPLDNTAWQTMDNGTWYWTVLAQDAAGAVISPNFAISTFEVTDQAGTGLSVSPSSLSLSVGQKGTVKVSGGTSPYKAVSSETPIATVSFSGTTLTVTGVAAGSATITITDSASASKSVSLTVTGGGSSLSTGLVAYYPFNGNAKDDSGNGYDAMVVNATLSDDQNGTPNSSYYFDGVDDYIKFGPVLPDMESMTIAIWVYSYDDGSTIVCEGDWAVGNDVTLKLPSSSSVNIRADKSGYKLNTSVTTTIPMYNVWRHIVWTMNSSESKVYVDNVLVETVTKGGSNEGYHNFILGTEEYPKGSLGWSGWWQGKISDLRIYNRVLSEWEIQELYQMDN